MISNHPVSYGAIPVRAMPWKQPPPPEVQLWPSGTIMAGTIAMNRGGAQELIRLLQLALRDQAGMQSDSV